MPYPRNHAKRHILRAVDITRYVFVSLKILTMISFILLKSQDKTYSQHATY